MTHTANRLYRQVEIPSLLELQRDLLSLFVESGAGRSFTYLPEQLQYRAVELIAPHIDPRMLASIGSVAAFFMYGYRTTPIHVDTGSFVASLNIPIYGHDTSLVQFFEYPDDVQPVNADTLNPTVDYKRFPEGGKLILSKPTSVPAIINTTVPHRVLGGDPRGRLSFLFRLLVDPSGLEPLTSTMSR
jgi:hypothetical protein